MNKEGLSERVAYRIVRHRVSIPTWVVLYINILIASLVANTVYLKDNLMFQEFAPFGGHLWSILLLIASLMTLHGLLANYNKTVAVGSIMGYMAWTMAFISWVTLAGADRLYGIPLLALPMIAFFMFVHLKHSIINRWEKSIEEEKASGVHL